MKDISVLVGTYVKDNIVFELEKNIKAGQLLRVRTNYLPPLRTMRASRIMCGSREMEIVKRFSNEEMKNGDWKWNIDNHPFVMFKTDKPIKKGEKITIEWTNIDELGKKTKPTSDVSGISWKFLLGSVESIRSDNLNLIAKEFKFSFVGDRAQTMKAYLKKDGRVYVQYFDSKGNSAIADSDQVFLKVNDVSMKYKVQKKLNANEYKIDRKGIKRVYVKDNKGREAATNYLPESDISMEGVNFGEIHWHSEFSGDGQRDLKDAMETAKYQYCLDFAGPADHINGIEFYRSPEYSFDRQKEILMSFAKKDRFAPVAGAEISGGYGHINFYGRDFETFNDMIKRSRDAMELAFSSSRDRFPLKQLQAACIQDKTFYAPHHSNTDSAAIERVVDQNGRPKWNAIYFPLPGGDYPNMRLFEMVQGRGSFETETYQDKWHMKKHTGGRGGSARTGLMRGFRMGFVAGTDNHSGWPTRSGGGVGYTGCTAVLTNDLSMSGIFDALYNRRCYATTGARIVADYSVSGHPMGSEIKANPQSRRIFDIEIHGTDIIELVEIIHCGYTLASLDVNGTCDFRGSFEDDRPGRPLEDAWYYVRARQVDGECLWMSPVWFDLD